MVTLPPNAAPFGAQVLAQTASPNTPTNAPPSSDLSQDFEKMVLSNFVDEMMKTVKTGAFGSEKDAQMWRSFLSDAIAEQLTLQGGLGLQRHVSDVVSAYQSPGKSTDTPPGNT